ncbi:GntR family transcriptional regulator [Tsukamurella spumae]|uniref:GntR family transcriptional regulator n=1 Tax=Tsukamurella spumae TaxID=44753 RepID=A0A846X568_9ACTN|nr:GntR family transcriptional regulator [Tsukamurella spumae]NKY18970.1 GntR family transcriptional regulator [Tsukamurella spumae]
MAESNAERVRAELRKRIIAGDLEAGERLGEGALSRELGVSRVPIREAMRLLETEGLVESRPFAGVRVADLAPDEAGELFDIRLALERATAGRAARRAAANRDDGVEDGDWADLRTRLDAVLAEGDAALAAGDLEPLTQLNMQFHHLIAELSGSRTMVLLLRTIAGSIERLYTADARRRAPTSWPEHHGIIAAIDAGDPDAAGMAMAAHVRKSKRSYLRGRT